MITAHPVLVTGASSGIGRATAELLAQRGMPVVGTVRRPVDAEALAAIGVEPLLLDVTDATQLDGLRERLAGATLAGVVNNAGIVEPGPVEGLSLDEVRRQLEVNVVGVVAVTQAALPALRAGRGRIVNVGSIGGSVPPPFLGLYGPSKAAVANLSTVLRHELRPFGIHVALVEPGAIATPMWDKGLERADAAVAALSPGLQELYGARIAGVRRLSERQIAAAIAPARVAATIAHALTARRPKARYTVGRDAKVQRAAGTVLPWRLFDRALARMI